MTRLAALALGTCLLGALASQADASPPKAARLPYLTIPGKPRAVKTPYTLTNQTLFINRCVGGCNMRPGTDDATTDTSEIVGAATAVPEFDWPVGEWEAIMQCVKEVYSPFNVVVTDVRPTSGVYNMTVVGGSAALIAAPNSCGLGIVNPDCGPNVNGVSFAFTGGAGGNSSDTGCRSQVAQEDDNNPVWGMCFVIAQESAHNYGLDHEIMFLDGMSACSDPMSYETACGGEKFFRNQFAHCSENNTGAPKDFCGSANSCGTSQNSHQKLLTALGAGTPITTPPVVEIIAPPAGTVVVAGATVHATASAQRGVGTTELYLNGFKWASAPGASFGQSGQPPSDYAMTLPNSVPDSVIDVVVRAYDDILVTTDSAPITVTKGKAGGCVEANVNADGTVDTCAKGQKCITKADGGRCTWDAPVGQLGDACDYPQFCTTGVCQGAAGAPTCTEQCFVSIADSCPMGFQCNVTNGNNGICEAAGAGGGGGCCSVGHSDTGTLVAQGGLALGALALVFRRRRRA